MMFYHVASPMVPILTRGRNSCRLSFKLFFLTTLVASTISTPICSFPSEVGQSGEMLLDQPQIIVLRRPNSFMNDSESQAANGDVGGDVTPFMKSTQSQLRQPESRRDNTTDDLGYIGLKNGTQDLGVLSCVVPQTPATGDAGSIYSCATINTTTNTTTTTTTATNPTTNTTTNSTADFFRHPTLFQSVTLPDLANGTKFVANQDSGRCLTLIGDFRLVLTTCQTGMEVQVFFRNGTVIQPPNHRRSVGNDGSNEPQMDWRMNATDTAVTMMAGNTSSTALAAKSTSVQWDEMILR